MKTLMRVAALASISILTSGCAGVFGGLHHVAPSSTDDGGGGSTGTSGPVSESAFQCPTSDSTSSVVRSAAALRGGSSIRHRFTSFAHLSEATPDLVAIDYDARSFSSNREALSLREQALGATFVREYDFTHTGVITRVVRPASGSVTSLEGALRTMPGVRSVGTTGRMRHLDSVSGPFLTNDPYFEGFGDAAPLYESSDTEGQWDMHVTRLEYAFAYSEAGNGSSATNIDALGSANVKVAILDSGVDTAHLDLTNASGKPKSVYQRCFITDPNANQSTSNFVTDPAGHGTFVSGLAAAEPDNGFGFAGAGGNVSIDAYRIYPTPDDSCVTDSPDAQCGVNTQDVASAIEDAVAQKVNVINMSFGSGTCTVAGVDDDTVEGNAVADAIAANIVVVAASGDDGAAALEAPACDTGVIAVGSTGLSDGIANNSGNTSGTATSPREYVPSYSNYGTPGVSTNDANAWGIVAPGGDPSGSTDTDNLHFIENIWTSTPAIDALTGTCTADDTVSGGAIDCHAFYAGTSISAPIVSGAAALVLSVSGKYQSPALMKQLLCSTADDIGSLSQGCGRLDIYRAMAIAVKDQFPPAPRATP